MAAQIPDKNARTKLDPKT